MKFLVFFVIFLAKSVSFLQILIVTVDWCYFCKDCYYIINEFNVTSCWPGVFANSSVVTPENSSSTLNVTAIFSDVIHTLSVIGQINVPLNTEDEEFQRVLFRLKVDISKILEDSHAHYIKPVLIALLKSFSFDLKFPVQKVRKRNLEIELLR